MTKLLTNLSQRGRTVPGIWRYALKVYGDALGSVFTSDQPSDLQAATVLGHRPKSAPGLDTVFVFALGAAANN